MFTGCTTITTSILEHFYHPKRQPMHDGVTPHLLHLAFGIFYFLVHYFVFYEVGIVVLILKYFEITYMKMPSMVSI